MLEISKKKLQPLSIAPKHTRLYPAVRIHRTRTAHVTAKRPSVTHNKTQHCNVPTVPQSVQDAASFTAVSAPPTQGNHTDRHTKLAHCCISNTFPVNMDEYFRTGRYPTRTGMLHLDKPLHSSATPTCQIENISSQDE
jgi:hypothetical protein